VEGVGYRGVNEPNRLQFEIPMLPPSVNHYVQHKAQGVHVKTAQAKAFERDFPLFSRGGFVIGEQFSVVFHFVPGPGDKGDVDNRNKCLLDCIAKAGMLRNRKGKELSDAWVKRMVVEIHDSAEERRTGPRTVVQIEALVWQ
jgi:Holliday junction resolvase RusA-like endonuclease